MILQITCKGYYDTCQVQSFVLSCTFESDNTFYIELAGADGHDINLELITALKVHKFLQFTATVNHEVYY